MSIEIVKGRLMYSSGETEKAIRLFLGLLRGSTHSIEIDTIENIPSEVENIDKIYLDDFKDIFQVFTSRPGKKAQTHYFQ